RLRNSFAYAEQAGLEFSFTFSGHPAPHPNTARIVLETCGGESIDILGASVGGGNIEILEIDGMEVSFSCNYPTLLVFHRDMPGAIQRVTGVLAENSINIAFMRIFRTARSEDACMVIEMDGMPPHDVVAHIMAVAPEIRRACVL
ncbi:ACT domain-containing protein, partial [bacterium]|nr:ACT domain-containing protein [bacterium]